jgi:alkaline phosphatase D
MTDRRPDLFLFVGDTIYADHTCGTTPHLPGASFIAETLGDFHAKHRYNRADRVVQRFFRTTPVEAIWDDHEVRNNFAGPSEPLMAVGRRAFLDYWPMRGTPEEPARLYRRVRWGRHLEMFVLDTRQYRSRNDDADGSTKTMLGAAQRAWLLDGLRESDATWKVIVSSVPLGQFTGGKIADAWSASNVLGFTRTGRGFTHERDTILHTLQEAGVRNLVVLSGDVHHGELIRHEPWPGFVIHEFLAGPLAARQGFKRFLDRSLHSRSLGSLGWANNFGEITVDGDRLEVRILDTGGATRVSFRVGAEPPVLEARRVSSRAVIPGEGEHR